MAVPPANRHRLAYYLLIVLLASVPFVSLLNAGFVQWDDVVYVSENARVQKGVTVENAKWAFSTIYFGFYYPVTWLSHMLDCSLFGLWAGGHHLTSIVFHVLNSLLLFVFFRRATSEEGKSFLIAVLFAVHPLNVESVAWISERKNLLAAFFFLLGLNLYLNYVRTPTKMNFFKLFVCYLLGLMSKTVLVTFPFGLLLLDVWPLRRISLSGNIFKNKKNVIYEKLLLLIPVPFFSYLTIVAQQQADALGSLSAFPLDQRVAGAVLAYFRYICQFFFPLHLTAFYPHLKDNFTGVAVISSVLLLVALSAIFLVLLKKEPVYIAGWLWFLGHLVPVLGIIQVGRQASADRYMYLPMIGLLAILVFGLGARIHKLYPRTAPLLKYAVLAMTALFLFKSFGQALTWRNNETLFSNMTAVSPDAFEGHYNMGVISERKGAPGEAIEHYGKALECDPVRAEAYNNIGACHVALNDWGKAHPFFKKAVELAPEDPEILFNFALSCKVLGGNYDAKKALMKVLQIDDRHETARKRLIEILSSEGNYQAALELAAEGERLFPGEAGFASMKNILSEKTEEK